MPLPSVSVIILNFNGCRHLEACFRSLIEQEYAGSIELIMVDNGSADGSVELMRAQFPQVRLLVNTQNVGFAPAVNQAARVAEGDYLALMNNDARAAPDWLAQLVELAERRRDEGVACVASRVLGWDGEQIDFVVGSMNFHGFGAQPFFRMPAAALDAGEEPLLFAN